MPNYSLGEIDALARKATRGAGYSWGIAEEAGKAVRWLSAYGFSGAEALAHHLQMVEATKQDLVPNLSKETSEEITFNNDEGTLCSLYCGALINDLGHHVYANKTLVFRDVSFPILALSAAGRIAEAYGISVSFTYYQTTIILDSKGIVLNDTPPLIDTFYLANKADVICKSVQSNFNNTHYPSPESRAMSQGVLQVLDKFAHTTYAPATAESRLRGAGEG